MLHYLVFQAICLSVPAGNHEKTGESMKKLYLVLCILMVCFVAPAVAQEQEVVDNGQDFTRPRTRVDFRYQYQDTPPAHSDDLHIVTLRADKPFAISEKWELATRVDVPFAATNMPSLDNLDADITIGTGDLLAQAFLITSVSEETAYAFGAQFIFPTASEDQMGGGKYRAVPSFGVRVMAPEITRGSWYALLVRYDFDFAGDDDRADISELQLAPVVYVNLPNQWFVNFYPSSDIRYNFADKRPGDDGRLFLPFDIMVGKLLTKDMIASLEVAFPLVQNYQVYDFKAEARVGYLF